MSYVEFTRNVRAPHDITWAAVSDLAGYANVAPNLTGAEVVEGEGVGMRRRCWDANGRSWHEQCTLWEDGSRYAMEVDANEVLFPFRKLRGTWGVIAGESGSTITMRFDYQMRYGLLGRLLDRIYVRGAFRKVCSELMDNWQREIEDRAKIAHNV